MIDKVFYINNLKESRRLQIEKGLLKLFRYDQIEKIDCCVHSKENDCHIEILKKAKARKYECYIVITEEIRDIDLKYIKNNIDTFTQKQEILILKNTDKKIGYIVNKIYFKKLEEDLVGNKWRQESNKEKVPGIILVTSCYKYLNSRLTKLGLKNDYFNNWKIHIVLGNPNLEEDYKFEGKFLIIKCEDSYIHLIKKVGKAMDILRKVYDIEQGIVRCGDDLYFNEMLFKKFLEEDKEDYVGRIVYIETERNTFMERYYKVHTEDFKNPLHGLENLNAKDIEKYGYMPEGLRYAAGVLMYFSLKSIDIIVNQLKHINYNVFQEVIVNNKKCYPFTIEDVGLGLILKKNNIFPKNEMIWKDVYDPNCLCYHTNMDKGL